MRRPNITNGTLSKIHLMKLLNGFPVVLLSILAFGWIAQPPSNLEMLANVSRALDLGRA